MDARLSFSFEGSAGSMPADPPSLLPVPAWRAWQSRFPAVQRSGDVGQAVLRRASTAVFHSAAARAVARRNPAALRVGAMSWPFAPATPTPTRQGGRDQWDVE